MPDIITDRALTVVYTINDGRAFGAERKRLMSVFQNPEDKPWAVTAMSRGHEIHRLALIEEAHDMGRHDLLDGLFGLLDPLDFKDIEEFIASR